MEDLLFIAHRIPYPPNKGDKIRSFNILKHLAKYYRVHLASFIDAPEDKEYVGILKQYTASQNIVSINPKTRRLLSAPALFAGQSLSCWFYDHNAMQGWIDNAIQANNIQKAVVFSSPMARFFRDKKYDSLLKIMDMVDVDSEKWLQYGEKHTFPMSWIFNREGTALRRFEREIARRFDATLLVSEQEANLFKKIAPESANKIQAVLNGVNTQYFDPALTYTNVYNLEEQPIVFAGAMDYWANIDAVDWFASKVFPAIRNAIPTASFYIVGSKPTDKVKKLENLPNIKVTGSVDDIRPYIKHAKVSVAPLQIARGIQNKVLEALSMSKQIVATPQAIEGITSPESALVTVESQPDAFATATIQLLEKQNDVELNDSARDFVIENFSWESHLSNIDKLLT